MPTSRRRGPGVALAALLAFAACPVPAAAEAQESRQTGVSAVELFSIAEAARQTNRPDDAEAIYRALASDPDAEIRAEARFRHAQMLIASGRRREGALLLRALLDEKPDAARARLELAAVLLQLEDEGGARRQLRQAQAAGLPRDVSLAIDQFANALRARQPFGGSLSFAIVPDSNINRATDAQTLDTVIAPLDLTEDARGQSGLGLRIGGQAFARVPLGTRLTLLPRASAQAELYRQNEFNDISASLALGVELTRTRDRLRPSIAQTVRYFGGELHAQTRSIAVNWLRLLGRRSQLDATATAARADYRRNDLQDGWLFDLSASYERAFDARSGGSLTVAGGRHSARDPGYSTTSGGAALVYWREVGRLTLFGSLGLRRLEADERLLLFPERRRDWNASASAGGTVRHFSYRGFAPLIRLSYERNASTVGLYDYRRTAIDFGATRAF